MGLSEELNGVLVRYDEVGLKSNRVRRRFENLLIRRVEEALDYHGVSFDRVCRYAGRVVVFAEEPGDAARASASVFGVASTSPVVARETGFDGAIEFAGRMGEEVLDASTSFAIRSRRVGKHDFTSMDVAREAGAEVQRRTGAPVDLSGPDVEIFVEVRGGRALFFTERFDGPGGLPKGSQGKLVALISGGIDSPVAAWLMMRRGAEVVPVFLDSDPFTDATTRGRAVSSIEKLAEWNHGPMRSYVVPHGKTLEALLNHGERSLTCVTCRRMMYLVAERVAEVEGCDGLITGESLGQVASQTYRNLRAEDEAVSLPVYRPVIGLDKLEIVGRANSIGTFDASTEPATCCTVTPHHPETYASLDEVRESEGELDVEGLLDTALDGAEVVDMGARTAAAVGEDPG